ncbi:MAG: ATP-binding protein [Chloroflexales bacterium]
MALKLTPRLILLFTSFAVLLLGGLGGLSYASARTALRDAVEADLYSTALEKVAALESWFADRQGDLAGLSQSPDVLANAERLYRDTSVAHDGLVEELQVRAGANLHFLRLFVLNPDTGRIVASTVPADEGTYSGQSPYFLGGRSAPYVQIIQYSTETQRTSLIIATPLHDGNGKLLGVLAGELNIADLTAITQRHANLRPSEDSFLINVTNLLVTQPLIVADPDVMRQPILTEASKRCLSGERGTILADDYRGVPVVVHYTWMNERQLCMIVKIDQRDAFAPADALGWQMLIIGVLFLGFGMIGAILLARTITGPILTLQAGVARFSAGARDLRIPDRAPDEVGALARDFNQMMMTLSAQEAELQRYAADLEQLVAARTAALARSNAELEQFAYVASHDLQEPLRMVSSYTQLLARRYQGKLDSDADEFIAYAVDGAMRMQKLINDLLAYSRVGTRGKPLAPVDCDKILAQALANLALAIEESGTLVTHTELPVLTGDETQLTQLFQNLIGNAIKFHGADPPQIHVAAVWADGKWRFAVRDNGIGIEEAYFERIFVIFQRLHTRDTYPGTGIGLAICKKIVERHGGQMWVESAPGAGTTFFFTLGNVRSERDEPRANRDSAG